MSTALGIDFGERRIGIAWASLPDGLPEPLCTLTRHSDASAVSEIADIAREYEAEALVLGEPLTPDGQRNANCERVRRFAAKLRETTELETHFVTETLTTVAAVERLASSGIKASRFKPGLDAMAAAILLEDYLNRMAAQQKGPGIETETTDVVNIENDPGREVLSVRSPHSCTTDRSDS